jgi:hypothetical protein
MADNTGASRQARLRAARLAAGWRRAEIWIPPGGLTPDEIASALKKMAVAADWAEKTPTDTLADLKTQLRAIIDAIEGR